MLSSVMIFWCDCLFVSGTLLINAVDLKAQDVKSLTMMTTLHAREKSQIGTNQQPYLPEIKLDRMNDLHPYVSFVLQSLPSICCFFS